MEENEIQKIIEEFIKKLGYVPKFKIYKYFKIEGEEVLIRVPEDISSN